MTRSYQCWVYFFLLVACQLCAAFGDVGVGVCTSFADERDCGINNGNPSIISHNDDDGSIAMDNTKGDEAIHIDSFIEASMARAGPVAKYSRIAGTFFGAFLPEAVNPVHSMGTHQAGQCFDKIDIVLEELRDASLTASVAETSSAGMHAPSWFFCPSTKTLVPMDPAMPASYISAPTLSPLFVEDKVEKKEQNDDWDIDAFLNGIFFEGESPLCPEAKSDANGGGLEAVGACYYAISDNIDSKNSEEDDSNNMTDDIDDDSDGIGRQAPPPARDPSTPPMNEASPAPAPAMAPSWFSFSKARPPLPSAMDPTLFPFAEESYPPAPDMEPSVSGIDDESEPDAPALNDPPLSPIFEETVFEETKALQKVLASNSGAHMPSPLFVEDGNEDEKDTDEGDIDLFLDALFVNDDDDDDPPPPLCPRAKYYLTPDGSEAVDTCSVQPMDQTEHPSHTSANVNGYANHFDIAIDNSIYVDIDNSIGIDIDGIDNYIDHGGFGKGLYLHESTPSVCPVSSLPPIAPVMGPSLASLFFDRGPEFGLRWKQYREAIGDKVRLDDYDAYRQEAFLAEACRAEATSEPFTLEAFIAASDRKEQERKMIEEGVHEEKSLARNILGVVGNVAGYVGSLLKEVLPAWINPTAGQIRRADECFRVVGSMSVGPGRDPLATKRSSYDAFAPAASDADNASDASAAFGAFMDVGNDEGGGWFYCAHHKRFVQLDPVFVCPSKADTGRSGKPLSTPSVTKHLEGQDEDDDEDEDAQDSLFDALLAADRARYEAEHMKLAVYVDAHLHLPAAVEARLARHVAELIDERAEIDAVLEGILERDEEDERQAALERHIVTEMQRILFGGGDRQREEEEPLPPVCQENEYYPFVPADTSKTKCEPLPVISRPPPVDECAPPETLQGNDRLATSRGDCRLYLYNNPFHDTPIYLEENFTSSMFYDIAASPLDCPECLHDVPGTTTQVPGQSWAIGSLRERLPERLVILLAGAWNDACQTIEPVFHQLRLRLAKLFEQVSSLADDGSIKSNLKGGEAVDMKSFVEASVARTGSAAFSRMVAKYASIVDKHFGAFLPDEVSPTRFMATRHADMCFQDMNSMLGYLLSASPTAVATAEKASTAAGIVAGDTSSVWMYCAHTQSLVQLDPTVLAARGNAFTLSPLLFAEGGREEEDEDDNDDDDRDIDAFLNSENYGIANTDDGGDDGDDDDTDVNETDSNSVTDDGVADDTDGSSVTDSTTTNDDSGTADTENVSDTTTPATPPSSPRHGTPS